MRDELSKMICDTRVKVEKEILDNEYADVELNLNLQYRKYVEMLNAQPDHVAWRRTLKRASQFTWGKKDPARIVCPCDGADNFSGRPLLEVYFYHSKGDHHTMEQVCKRSMFLFNLVILALIGYTTLMGGSEDGVIQGWGKKLEEVEEKMEEVLLRCK